MIPCVIHQIWEGKQSALPDNLKKLGATWRKYNPDWTYILWDYESMDKFIRDNYSWQLYRNYYRLSYNIQRWDVMRYLILYKLGGVYADSDTECYRPLDSFIERMEKNGQRIFFQKDTIFEGEKHVIAPSIMGAEAGCELLFNMFDRILNTGFYKYNYVSIKWRTTDTVTSTGPYGIQKDFENYINKEEVYVASEKEFIPCKLPQNVLEIPFADRGKEFAGMYSADSIAAHYFFYSWIKHCSTEESQMTVIIPFLNEGEEVRKTVESVRATSCLKVTIILINDASDDGYDYESVANEFDCRYVLHDSRKGVAASRDEGVGICETKYFLLLDAHMEFYDKGWDERLELICSENPHGIICCQTKVLWNIRENICTDKPATYGASMSFSKNDVLKCTWNYNDPDPDSVIVEIPVILGGAYAAKKEYWQRLHGLRGLVNYGMDEELISMKAWCEGGRCLLVKNLYVGHIYRNKFPYPVLNDYILNNQILIAELFFENEIKQRLLDGFKDKYGETFDRVYGQRDVSLIETERDYLKSINRKDLSHFLFKNTELCTISS